MASNAVTVDEYLKQLPADRREAVGKLRDTVLKNIPKGFREGISYGMIGYFVPHEIYPAGYHCNPKIPLPFVNIGSQKNFIVMHHIGIYGSPKMSEWFVTEYPKHSIKKLDMGKGCIRFKDPEMIPYKLIGELMKKITVKEWIKLYEDNLKLSKRG